MIVIQNVRRANWYPIRLAQPIFPLSGWPEPFPLVLPPLRH